MTKYIRKTAKLFGESANPADNATTQGPEIGQFGSALIGTYNGTADIDTIQGLPAWQQGFIGAVTPTNQYPPLPEMTGFGKVLSYELCYLLQQGIPEWDYNTTYYINGFCSKNGKIYISNTNSNLSNDPETDTVNWRQFEGIGRSHNLFDVVLKDHLLTYDDTMGFTLQGEYAYKDPVNEQHYGYPTFYNRCISEMNEGTATQTVLGNSTITTYNNANGHIYYNIADKSVVDTYFNTYGVAWFYGVDTTNERILMPRNNYFFKSAATSPGGLNLPGAPDIAHTHSRGTMNITGQFGRKHTESYQGAYFTQYSTTGAFSVKDPGRYNSWPGSAAKLPNSGVEVTFDASQTWTGNTSQPSVSNSIYGRETDQIMVTSANGLLYICTGNTIDEGAISLNAALISALNTLDSAKDDAIDDLGDAKDDAIDDINDAKDDAIADVGDEVDRATEEADRAKDEADRAERYADTVVAGQMQADWTQTDTQAVDYIRNKPTNLVTETGIQTLTNKTISASDNTITNLLVENFSNTAISNGIPPVADSSMYKFTSEYGVADAIEGVYQRLEELQIAKNPNLSIVGDLTISSGNVSGFTASDYLQFPYVWNFGNYTWDLEFQFTTSSDVTTQQNIIDSYYGVSVAISSGHFILSISSNGTSWDIANSSVGTYDVEAEVVYTLKLSWDGSDYKLSYSLDQDEYIDDITVSSTSVHYATQEYVGGSPNLFGAGTAHPFGGTINLNPWKLTVNDLVVWFGMDDVGLASRANVSLTNLDDVGLAKFSSLQDQIDSKEAIAPGIIALTTSGTTVLQDNKVYHIIPSGNITFSLPTITDTTVLHRIELEIDMSTVYSIDLGLGATPKYYNNTPPDLSTAGTYSILYQYSPTESAWYCGGASIGA